MTTRQEAFEALDVIEHPKYLPGVDELARPDQNDFETLRSYLNQCGEPAAYQWRYRLRIDGQWLAWWEWQNGRVETIRNGLIQTEERELFAGPPGALASADAAAKTPPLSATWLHLKRGTLYTEIGRAELQTSCGDLADGSEMVVYRGEDGKLWVRETAEFEDGRFWRVQPVEGQR